MKNKTLKKIVIVLIAILVIELIYQLSKFNSWQNWLKPEPTIKKYGE